MDFLPVDFSVKVKGLLTIRSSRERLRGCSALLALLAKEASVQLLGHVASMTKPLLAKPEQHMETPFTFLPERYLFIYLHSVLLNS